MLHLNKYNMAVSANWHSFEAEWEWETSDVVPVAHEAFIGRDCRPQPSFAVAVFTMWFACLSNA